MDLEQISAWRSLAGKAAAGFCLLALVALLDGLIGQFREPANVVKLLPGGATEINGALAEKVQGVQDLTVVSDTGQLEVAIEAVHKGYFLGGEMWRGQLTASPRIQPGEYHLTVNPKKMHAPGTPPALRILVYPDSLSRQRSYRSFIRRYGDVPPFGVAAGCLPGILLAFGLVYYLSGRREALLAQGGQAEVYRVQRQEGGCEIRFALGTTHGLGPGVQVQIWDGQGQRVGLAQVEESNLTDSRAVLTGDQEIKTGYLVSR